MPKVLSPLQARVLTLFFEHGAAAHGYFLTGGTALSEYYFQHRYSEDRDFFSRSERDASQDSREFQKVLDSLALETTAELTSSTFARLYVGPEKLKVDLANDVKAQMAPVENFSGVLVDSLEDIAINKVCALSRHEPKDYIDLYFILTGTTWTLEYLLERARLKDSVFEDPRGHLQFASDLTLAGAFNLPATMLRSLNLAEMLDRFTAEAQKIMDRYAPKR